MALPTPTVNAITGIRPTAPLSFIDISVAGENTYATGGMTGAAAKFQAAAKAAGYNVVITKDNIFGILPIDTKGYLVAYDKAADTVKLYYADYDANADGALIEPNGVNLASVTFRFTLVVQ